VRGCLFTLLLGAVVIALVVVVGLPAVAAGALTAGVKAAGLQANDITVNVTSDPPWDLLGLSADRVRVRATNATFRDLRIGALDLTLLGVSIPGRTTEGVAGRLTGVTVPNVAGQPLGLSAITLSGGGDQVTATTTITAADAAALVAAEVASVTGMPVPASAVHFAAPNKVVVRTPVAPITATLSTNANGDLVATAPGIPPVTVLHAGEDLPLRLTSVSVDAAGNVELAGTMAVSLLG
jgi:hypothetical protein